MSRELYEFFCVDKINFFIIIGDDISYLINFTKNAQDDLTK